MQIRFATKKLQKTCNEIASLVKAYGAANARLIAHRLNALSAYPSLGDVPSSPPERCHPLHGDRAGQYAVDVKHPFRIIFVPDHEPLPRKPDGGLDPRAVTDLCILEITDYH